MANRASTRERALAAETTALPPICRHLGLVEDRTCHEDQASRQHRCYFTAPPQRVDLDHQRHFCLKPACAECPWLTIDDLPMSIRVAEPEDLQKVGQAVGAVAKGLKTVAQIGGPILKDAAERAAEAIQEGAEAVQETIQERVAAIQSGHDQAAAQAGAADGQAAAGLLALPAVEPPRYRILTLAPVAPRETARTRWPHWRTSVRDLTPEIAALGAFLAALFWLSSIYRGWLPADMATQALWPTFQLPVLPLAFRVDILELTFDLAFAIPQAIGALWAWLAFRILQREESDVFLALLCTIGGTIAVHSFVTGQAAIQFGLLCQSVPAVFVLITRLAVGQRPPMAITTR